MITAADARHFLSEMIRIRRFEEKTIELYQAELIRGFLHVYIGEEAIAVGIMQALTSDDAVLGTHREHGHALARGLPMGAVMAEMLGKVEGCSRGRGGSMHLFDAERRFYGGSAIVASCLPIAAGLALADKMRGLERVTAVFFGEGAAAEGEFHEVMNLAALWQLPVLFCCENNVYGMGTAIERAQARPDLTVRARAYGVPAITVDGMDVVEVAAAATESVASIRADGGPRFLLLETYRFRGHSMFDAELYRSPDEVKEWRKRDPITIFTEYVVSGGILTENQCAEIDAAAMAEVDEAVAFAEAGTLERVDDLTRFVYSEVGP